MKNNNTYFFINIKVALSILLGVAFSSASYAHKLSDSHFISVEYATWHLHQKEDSIEVDKIVVSANEDFDSGNFDASLKKATMALELAQKIQYKEGIVRSNIIIGTVYKVKREFGTALDYYLKANQIVSTINDKQLKFFVQSETASLYQDWNVLEKAIENYLLALETSKSLEKSTYIKTLQVLAFLYQQSNDSEKSIEYFKKLVNAYKEQGNTVGQVSTLGKISTIYIKQQKYEEALALNLEILEIKKGQGDENSMSKQYNEIGFIQRQLNRDSEALRYFKQALEIQRKLNKPEIDNASLLINMAVINQRQRNFDEAIALYNDARKAFEEADRKSDVARMYIYLAATYFGIDDLANARKSAEQAIKYAEKVDDFAIQEKAYNRLAGIYERQGNTGKALEAYKNYMRVKEQDFNKEKKRLNQVTQNQISAEKQEKRLKLLMVDQELKNAEFEKLEVQKEKQAQDLAIKEQQLALLKQQKDLQQANLKAEQFEKDRVAQALRLAEEQLMVEKRNEEIEDLQQAQELRELELRKKELEEQEQQKAIKLLESETKLLTQESELQRIKLEEAKRERLYGLGIIGLFVAVLVLIIVGYRGKQRANKKLEQQNEEITEQKKEIEATASQLELANKAVQAQKEELEFKNIRLTDSIVYAQRIQNAILPIKENINNVFQDHFCIFLPKDMVSGDFYWFTRLETENKTFFAVVDCTGHGVPGAFMSMIGNTLLNQIVKEQAIYEPHRILETLHYNVRESLKQRSSDNADGMDVGIICVEHWEDGVISLKFSGAKIPLFLAHQGRLEHIRGDRKSIGGWQKDKTHEFTPHTMQIEKGDMIYLTTDGIIDIANKYRERLGSSKLRNFIFENHQRPLNEQKNKLQQLIDEHQVGADQRDDITLVGLKV